MLVDGYATLEALWTKDEAFQTYKTFSWAQTQPDGAHMKRLRSDRGGEFTGDKFTAYIQQQRHGASP
jgi:hypothetical protein